jgi:hypothetical protein
LTAIIGTPPLVWLLDFPGQVTPPSWHLRLVLTVLCKADIKDEAELRFVWTGGAGV